jgi:hypothetical protein
MEPGAADFIVDKDFFSVEQTARFKDLIEMKK